jgi:hypothetical protein
VGECIAARSGCSAGGTALALIPGLPELKGHVTGAGGEIYYAADHYVTFTRVK